MVRIESKTERLIDILLQEIVAGLYPPNVCLPSERELSGRHEVSRITVRRALAALEKRGVLTRRQGRGTFVAVRRPDTTSRQLPPAAKRVGFLLVIQRWDNWFFETVFHNFKEFVDSSVATSFYFQDYIAPEVYRRDKVDLLIVDGAFDDTVLADLQKNGFRTIMLNRVTAAGQYVCTNNELGGRRMMEHLALNGHRSVGVFPATPAKGALPGDEMALRIRGISQAARQRGVKLVELRPLADGAVSLHQVVRNSLRRGPAYTAVAALTDRHAQLVYDELLHAGITVPDDVSLIGYDDRLYNPFLPVPLTSIRQPLSDIGRALARVVNEWLAGNPLRIRRQFAPVLIERSSVRDLTLPARGKRR